MKHLFKGIYTLLAFAMMCIVASCSDKIEDDIEQDELQVELSPELQAKLDFGCVTFSEIFSKEKIETEANDEYRDFMMQRYLAMNKSARPYTDDEEEYSYYVGIIKDATCGGYREIKVYFDSEDSNNQNSDYGWLPGGITRGSHNLTMYFCMVPAYKFHSIGKNYAVLKIGAKVNPNFEELSEGQWRASIMTRHMDAEDNSPMTSLSMTYTDYNTQSTKNFNTTETIDRIGPSLYVYSNKNMDISFLCFYEGNLTTQRYSETLWLGYGLPQLGFSYGVFGKVWENEINGERYMGYYKSDDQDSGNANAAYLLDYGATNRMDNVQIINISPYNEVNYIKNHTSSFNNRVNVPVSSRFSTTYNIFQNWLELGENTTFHISKNTIY